MTDDTDTNDGDEPDTDYWREELRAYLDARAWPDEWSVWTEHGTVTLEAPELGADDRTQLVQELERHGFSVASRSTSEQIELEGGGARLSHSYREGGA